MKIWMLRHGQTDWNVLRKVQGSSDIPLNDVGRAMAEESGQALAQIDFAYIFSSPLVRAKETAEYAAKYQDVEIILADELREIHFAGYEGITEAELDERGIHFHDMFFTHPETFKPAEGGETLEDTIERAGRFLKTYIEPMKEDVEHVLLVAHGEILHAMLAYMFKRPTSQLWGDGRTQNCEVHIVEWKDQQYHLIEEAKMIQKGEKL